MSIDARDRLAEALAELHHNRATFEKRVRAVLEQLTDEKLHLAAEWRRLIAARRRFVSVGKRLRRRWHLQHLAQQKELDRRAVLQAKGAQRLTAASSKLQEDQARLNETRLELVQAASMLRKEREELIAYRGRFEAARLGWDEQQQRRRNEAQVLEHRIDDLQNELAALEARRDPRSRATVFVETKHQKVA